MPNSLIKIRINVNYKKYTNSTPLVTSDDSYRFFMSIWDKGTIELQESYYILCVDSDGCVIGWRCINIGCSDRTTVDIRTTMCVAIGSGASKLIVAHNHPSGSLEPSGLDIDFTKRLRIITDVVDIQLVDHLIITKINHYSFYGRGLLVG